MELIYRRCCGLDIHKKGVSACLMVVEADGSLRKEVRSFQTMTADLLALSDWLSANAVTHVAMESTGVYWKPIFNILEGTFKLLLVNAQHSRGLPGRKTDVKDCEWIAEMLQHGLLRGSFVPERPQRELRELLRYRTTLIQERTAEVNRLQKVLEGANIKLASIASDIVGKSGREMLGMLAGGSTDSAAMADRAHAAMRRKIPQLQQALTGSIREHQRFMIAQQLAHIDFLDGAIWEVSREIEGRMVPFEEALALIDTIPGVNRRIAEGILAETGFDMDRFPTDGNIASWAGMCPGNNESGGKRKSGRTRKGNEALRVLLTQAAHAACRKKDSYLAAQYHRIAGRRGKNRAAIAVGHTILVIIYHMLKTKTPYKELGANYFDQRNREAVQRRLVRRLEALGNRVILQRVA